MVKERKEKPSSTSGELCEVVLMSFGSTQIFKTQDVQRTTRIIVFLTVYTWKRRLLLEFLSSVRSELSSCLIKKLF